MKIVFVLNTMGMTGGVKVIFEHANRLQARGHEVTVVHLLRLKKGRRGWLIGQLKRIKYFLLKTINRGINIDWFSLNRGIKILRVVNLEKIKNFDAIIATANETADWVSDLPGDSRKKFYFIQDYETWTRDARLVDATYKMPLQKIVIASWLKDLMNDKFNEAAAGAVLNGVDWNFFNCPNKIFNKNKIILMMYHILPKKGVGLGIKAYGRLKKDFPKIKLIMFGAYRPKEKLGPDIEFYFKPKQEKLRELYHQSDIFLHPSIAEGFGLCPMEAMAAKCAVVATDTGAIRDYAQKDKTAIIIPPNNINAIINVLRELLLNESKLREMAESGNRHIKNFDWDKAAEKFENILSRHD